MSFFKATAMRKIRYGNDDTQKCGISEHKHDSKLEIAVCQILQWREKAGEIRIVKSQAHVYLTEAKFHCIPDFECFDVKLGSPFYVEAKGFEVPRWRDIKKLWRVYGPAPMEVWKGTYRNPRLVETLRPQQQFTFGEAKR